MKLIIDIPENIFIKDDLIHFFGCYSQKLYEVIKDGTPLDNLRAEIDVIYKEDMECDGCSDMGMVLDIIDKYKREQE